MVYWYRNVDSGIEKKSGRDTGVIIESKSEMKLPTWGSGLLSSSSSISKKDNLPKFQGGSQNFEQVQMDVMELNLDFRLRKECEWVKWSIQFQKL